NKPAPPRRKLDIGKDNELKIYKKMLSEKSIDLEAYIRKVMPLFNSDKRKKTLTKAHESELESEDEDVDIMDSSDEEEL
ncbi:unnamed protein product, partial [Brachionus calyciflorus]